MKKIEEKQLRNLTLPVAICCGLLFHNILYKVNFLTPYLLFGMMFFTCSKISMKELKFNPMHGWLLLIQIFGGSALYLLLHRFNEPIAQGLMICIFTPVAVASPVVGGMLGADIAMMTTYVLLSNVTAALLAPVAFSVMMHADIPFLASFWHVMQRTLLLLVLPLIVSWLMSQFTPKAHSFVRRHQSISFYIWALCMMLLLGTTFHSIFTDHDADLRLELVLAVGALIICVVLFSLGKKMGTHYGDMPAGRQMMGQKNTGIGVWLTISFLHPLAAVGPACYIIWQNLMNSLEIYLSSRRSER